MGGGAGLGGLEEVAGRLLAIDAHMQIVALAGRNLEALAALRALAEAHSGRLFPLGYTDRVERLMACADLVITKPGGLTASECLALGVAMILHSPLPGHEDCNADYLLEQGAALKAQDAVALEYRVRRLLAEPARIATMRAHARRIGRPQAALEVLRIVLASPAAGA